MYGRAPCYIYLSAHPALQTKKLMKGFAPIVKLS